MNYALRKSDSRGVELVETALPVCRVDDVVIAPRYVGLCGTDLNILRGGRADRAQILGHEGVAEVVQAGDNVRAVCWGLDRIESGQSHKPGRSTWPQL